MDPIRSANDPEKELLDAHTHVLNHVCSFLNSTALKCAIQLGIPDTIQKHGKPMTLDELATSLSIHPNKAPSLYRLMRLLVHSKFFIKRVLSIGEEAFEITINSKLLLNNQPLTLAPFALMMIDPVMMESSNNFCSWFQNEEETPFYVYQRRSFWEYVSSEPTINKHFNEAMASDTLFVANLLMTNEEFKGMIEGVESLVDVGGGNGAMAKAIAKVFPKLAITVFDQPHVVKGLEGYGMNLKYVGGDMLEAIPCAQVLFLKWILHNWSDDQCIKILQRCKEAIPSKDQGGKVIIIDMVVQTSTKNETSNYLLSQYMCDIQMMNVCTGKERTEEEWEKLFMNAGFNYYKFYPILGPRSIIEIYP